MMENKVETEKTGYDSPHGTGTKKAPGIFWLNDLGKEFKIERTEDWDDCAGSDKSYAEMIRVRGSHDTYRIGKNPVAGLPHKVQFMPSNLYKYSETHLGLYMKDHRRAWTRLAEITGEKFNGFDPWEEDFIFPIERFPEVAKILEFRRRRQISSEQRKRLSEKMKSVRESKGKKSEDPTMKSNEQSVSLNTNFNDSIYGREITPPELPESKIGGDFDDLRGQDENRELASKGED